MAVGEAREGAAAEAVAAAREHARSRTGRAAMRELPPGWVNNPRRRHTHEPVWARRLAAWLLAGASAACALPTGASGRMRLVSVRADAPLGVRSARPLAHRTTADDEGALSPLDAPRTIRPVRDESGSSKLSYRASRAVTCGAACTREAGKAGRPCFASALAFCLRHGWLHRTVMYRYLRSFFVAWNHFPCSGSFGRPGAAIRRGPPRRAAAVPGQSNG